MPSHLSDVEIADYLDHALDARVGSADRGALPGLRLLSGPIEQIHKRPHGLIVLLPPVAVPRRIAPGRSNWASALAAAAVIAAVAMGLRIWPQSRVTDQCSTPNESSRLQ